MEEHIQAHLLKRIAMLEQHVAGSSEATAILPRLDGLRTAIGEMTSRYDARLTEVKSRNQQALSALKSLSERLERVKHQTSASEATEGSDVQTVTQESPAVPFSFSHEATRDFSYGDVGGELCSDVASASEMSFMSPGVYWRDPASIMAPNQWDMDPRTPKSPYPNHAACNDDSDDGDIRTPSPEWSPRGCQRRVPFPVSPASVSGVWATPPAPGPCAPGGLLQPLGGMPVAAGPCSPGSPESRGLPLQTPAPSPASYAASSPGAYAPASPAARSPPPPPGHRQHAAAGPGFEC